MHFCFIDESGAGDPNPKNPHDVLVLAGVIIPEARFMEFSERLDEIKSSFGLSRLDEIHSCRLDNDMKAQNITGFGTMTWEDRRQAVCHIWEAELARAHESERAKLSKPHNRDRAYIHLSATERLRLLEGICDLLAKLQTTVFVSAVDRDQYSRPLATYIPALLELNYQFHRLRGKAPGTFIHDDCNDEVKKLAKGVAQTYQKAMDLKSGSDKTICTLPIFRDSRWTAGIQMADLCSYSVRKYLSNRITPRMTGASSFERLFQKIEPLLLYPKHSSANLECDCRICSLYGDDDDS